MRVLSLSCLLGAAGGLALTPIAHAADLPLKAKAPAVQYVKICTLYGAGFYYIPGTDTCLKIGGHLRVDFHGGPSGGGTESVDFNANYDDETQREFHTRARAYATFDARSQTAFGTLRSYFVIGATYDGNGDGDAGPGVSPYMHRAFIQLAGFTWGLSSSIFDGYSVETHLNYSLATYGTVNSPGVWQWRYTAQFGNGLSASVAIEEPRARIKSIISGVGIGGGAPLGTPHVGARWPDVVGQLQASGSWGRFQVAVAVKDASAVGVPVTTAIDEVGWAAMAGGLFRVPGTRDTFGIQATYAKGATGYVTANANTAGGRFTTTKGGTDTVGFVTDAVVTGPNAIDLTTAWGIEAGYEHAWTPQLKTSVAGGYVHIEYSGAAALTICGAAALAAGCNPDTSFWNIGSRTQWTVVPNLSLALDVVYTHLDTASFGVGALGPRGNALGDANIWTYLVRVRRDFWP